MRYEVGTTVAFARVRFEDKGERAFGTLYNSKVHNLLGIDLLGIDVLPLKCKEHHKVTVEYHEDRGPTADGYIFEQEGGRLWANQYPNASYGQLDTSLDWKVHPYVSNEDFEKLDEKSEEYKFLVNNYFENFHTDALHMLADLHSAVYTAKLKDYWSEEDYKNMREYYDQFKAAIETAMEKKIIVAPWVVQKNDGTTFFSENVFRARYEDEPEVEL